MYYLCYIGNVYSVNGEKYMGRSPTPQPGKGVGGGASIPIVLATYSQVHVFAVFILPNPPNDIIRAKINATNETTKQPIGTVLFELLVLLIVSDISCSG